MSTKIASLYAEIGAKDTLTPSLANAKKGITDLKGTFAGFAASAAALTGVALAVGKAYNATVGEFTRYASEVRNITQISGESAEATSRLIQVADDYKLSSNDLMIAQRILAKEGYSLNIETMAKLSDEYLKLNTGAERQAFLTEKLGKSGAVFAEMMSQGSAAILEKSAAVSVGLVLDQEALDQARKYEMALDDLNDQWSALKISAGSAVVPFAAQTLTTANQLLAIFQTPGGLSELGRTIWQVMTGQAPEGATTTSWPTTGPVDPRTMGPFVYGPQPIETPFQGPQERGYSTEEELTSFQNLLGFAQDYSNIQDQISAKEAEIAMRRAQGYTDAGATIRGLKGDLSELQEAQKSFTDQFILQMLMASGAPAESLLAVAKNMGMIGDEAIEAYNQASKLSAAIANIPANQLKTFEMYVKLTGDVEKAVLLTTGGSGGATQWWQYSAQGKASGGQASGLFLTGDSPSGWTPWTEAVYAPGGAYVYNASETRRIFGGAGIRGYATGTNIKSKAINGVTGGPTSLYKEGFVDAAPPSVTQVLAEEVAAVVSAQVTSALVTTANQVTVAVAPMVQEQQQTTGATQQGTQIQAAGNREMVGAIEDMKYMLSAQLANMGGDIISAVLRGT